MMKLSVVILAAGLGKRMCSALPKVMHPIGSKPMLAHVFAAAQSLSPDAIYIVQNAIRPLLSECFKPEVVTNPLCKLTWVTQAQQLGTADALKSVLPYLDLSEREKEKEREGEEQVLILCGDTPLVSAELLDGFMKSLKPDLVKEHSCMGFISARVDNPTGFGRVLRDSQHCPIAIVEEREANAAVRAITEINSGIFCVSLRLLTSLLPKLSNQNTQQEYYLTDLVQLAVSEGKEITAYLAPNAEEVMGVNTRYQQALVERLYQQKQVQNLMAEGVSILDLNRVDIRGRLQCSPDVIIDVNTLFEGNNKIGARTKIGANCILVNCEIGEDVEILPFSYLSGVTVGKGCQIGPYARIRPETVLANNVKIGNFVEVKKSQIGTDSKINHLSYVGDAILGTSVNIGAGTITCNYDGLNKHQTIIEDDVHIGSDTQLVAPLRIKQGTTIAAGSTIIQDTEAGKLTLTQTLNQRVVDHWVRPVNQKINK